MPDIHIQPRACFGSPPVVETASRFCEEGIRVRSVFGNLAEKDSGSWHSYMRRDI